MIHHRFLFLLLVSSLFQLGCRYTNTPEHANELITQGWTGPTPEAPKTGEKSLYCYRTLGSRDCYSYRQNGWDHRLVAFHEPEADTPVFKMPAPVTSRPVGPKPAQSDRPSLQPMKLTPSVP